METVEGMGTRNGTATRGLLATCAVLLGVSAALFGLCGPFIDVAPDGFCPFVLEIFTLGITTGTSPTTYDPASNVSRLQMAAFLSRTVDGALKRHSRRSILGQFWNPQGSAVFGQTTFLGGSPYFAAADGGDIWVSNNGPQHIVNRVRASDGAPLGTWTSPCCGGIAVAMGKVLMTSPGTPGYLSVIDPTQPPGAATVVASNLGNGALGITFDGTRVWTANGNVVAGSVSIVTPSATIPWTVTTVTAGFKTPNGAVFDGSNVWVTDNNGSLFKLGSSGAILQTVSLGLYAFYPVFDGGAIWVPGIGANHQVAVVRASSGAILRILTGNGLNNPQVAAFDGERILVTNPDSDSVSLWKAADLTPLGSFPVPAGSGPFGACSDGINFFVALTSNGQLARF